MALTGDTAFIDLVKTLIKKFEGFRERPYLCPAGKWTIGWGITRYPNGKEVQPADCPEGMARDFADACLVSSLLRAWQELQPCLKRAVTLHQAAALTSLAFNVGVGARDGVKGDLADSTLVEKLNGGDFAGAADQFRVWNKAHVNGVLVELPGLRTRREAERAMFLTQDMPPKPSQDSGAG